MAQTAVGMEDQSPVMAGVGHAFDQLLAPSALRTDQHRCSGKGGRCAGGIHAPSIHHQHLQGVGPVRQIRQQQRQSRRFIKRRDQHRQPSHGFRS